MLPVTEYTCGLTVVAAGCARPSLIVAVETIPLENSAKASAFIAIPLESPPNGTVGLHGTRRNSDWRKLRTCINVAACTETSLGFGKGRLGRSCCL